MFEEIESIHSEYSKLDKAARILFLKGQWIRLNQCAYQLGDYLHLKGTISPEERERAQRLIEMINEVQAEGIKSQRKLTNDCVREIIKKLMGF